VNLLTTRCKIAIVDNFSTGSAVPTLRGADAAAGADRAGRACPSRHRLPIESGALDAFELVSREELNAAHANPGFRLSARRVPLRLSSLVP